MYHNHEENINKARQMQRYLKNPLFLDIYYLLQSFIKDAKEGHRKIQQLEEKLNKYESEEENKKLTAKNIRKYQKSGLEFLSNAVLLTRKQEKLMKNSKENKETKEKKKRGGKYGR